MSTVSPMAINGQKDNRTSIAFCRQQFATPVRSRPTVSDPTQESQLSFLEKKLVERSRFRNLEMSLKQTQKLMDFKS